MTSHIYPKTINNNTYYYYQRTYREKIDKNAKGTNKGSGKSKVRTESIYLGTADTIFEKLKEKHEAIEVKSIDFGFCSAVYQTACEIGLIDLLKKYITGTTNGIPRWIFFALTVINRLQNATSKEKTGQWSEKTILPQLLDFKPKQIEGKIFWEAAESIISEKELKIKRMNEPEIKNELFSGIDDEIFQNIEQELFVKLCDYTNMNPDILFYDTTNFFTYIEEPARSCLAKTGHNKESRHHLKQVGLAICIDKEYGIPLFYRLYRGNNHDSSTFKGIANEMMSQLNLGFKNVKDLVLVLDKGNNSRVNFLELKDKINWIGSLVLSQYPELEGIAVEEMKESFDDTSYLRLEKEIMGIECVVLLTYNEKLKRKQTNSLEGGIEKLKNKIIKKCSEYKRAPRTLPAGIKSLIKESRYGKFLNAEIRNGKIEFSLNNLTIKEHKKNFGKNLLFSSDKTKESAWIIQQYKAKYAVEDDFKLLKLPDLIRFRPIRHWTDTKIRAFGFCCVMALTVIKVMQLKALKAGLSMSANVLKEELSDLRLVAMVYDDKTSQTKITTPSSVQKKLWEVFNLEQIKTELTIH